jgi:hypothetical protein
VLIVAEGLHSSVTSSPHWGIMGQQPWRYHMTEWQPIGRQEPTDCQFANHWSPIWPPSKWHQEGQEATVPCITMESCKCLLISSSPLLKLDFAVISGLGVSLTNSSETLILLLCKIIRYYTGIVSYSLQMVFFSLSQLSLIDFVVCAVNLVIKYSLWEYISI